MALPQMELNTAQAVVGFAVLQTLSMYREAMPSVPELRSAPQNDYAMRQAILDADVYGGIAVVLIGGTAAILARTVLPLFIASLGLLMISAYHRSVLASPSPVRVTQPKGEK